MLREFWETGRINWRVSGVKMRRQETYQAMVEYGERLMELSTKIDSININIQTSDTWVHPDVLNLLNTYQKSYYTQINFPTIQRKRLLNISGHEMCIATDYIELGENPQEPERSPLID